MRSRLLSRRTYPLIRRFLASLLVCLMLPGSIADASSFVWCFSGDGHSAIERCHGPQCYSSAPSDAHLATGGVAEQAFAADQHHADCTDVELLPTAALSMVRSSDVEHSNLSGPGSFESPNLVDPASKSWVFYSSDFKRGPLSSATAGDIDPTVLLRRIAVLRI